MIKKSGGDRAGSLAALIAYYRFLALFPLLLLLTTAVAARARGGPGRAGWSALQAFGSYLLIYQLRHASQVYGFFASVLGLVSWLQLSAQLTLVAAEFNVVKTRRLWPRSIVQPPLVSVKALLQTPVA